MLNTFNTRSGKILYWPFSVQESDRSFPGRVKCGFKTVAIFLPRLGRKTPLPAIRRGLFKSNGTSKPVFIDVNQSPSLTSLADMNFYYELLPKRDGSIFLIPGRKNL